MTWIHWREYPLPVGFTRRGRSSYSLGNVLLRVSVAGHSMIYTGILSIFSGVGIILGVRRGYPTVAVLMEERQWYSS